ncbi:hypothetical protein M569_14244, partial [Genlisea aurea]
EFFFVAPASSFHSQDAVAGGFSAPSAAAFSFEHSINAVGVIPLLTATPCLAPPPAEVHGGDAAGGEGMLGDNSQRGRVGMQLWRHQQSSKKPMILEASNSGAGIATCQDCGNQAKKDCPHRRCRTCCKSRGYDCATHVKSTWVPAARRRERQLMSDGAADAAAAAPGSSHSTSGSKKPRLGGGASQTTTTSTSNTTPPRSVDTTITSNHHGDDFPGQVKAPAIFKCVRVTALDDGEDEYAYQAVVKIGGHIFKGFLYDQGRDGLPNISELYLGGNSGGAGAGKPTGTSSSTPVMDPADLYGGGMMGGSSGYGNHIN